MPTPTLHRAVCTAAVLAFAAWAHGAGAAPPLPALGADPGDITVSGLSSGGYAAAQFAVAFSKDVAGVGVVAGGPYDCAEGTAFNPTHRCACEPTETACAVLGAPLDAALSAQRAEGKSSLALVDPLGGLKKQRVWLFSGGQDRTVPTPLVGAVESFYITRMSTPRSRVMHVHDEEAGHGMPVKAQGSGTVGVPCGDTAYPYLTTCGIDAAGDLLRWLMPHIARLVPAATGELREFDQAPYTAGLGETGLGSTGYVYVPDTCTAAGARCRVHVVFHGCRQARDADDGQGGTAGATFATHAGYNRWAAGSRLIVLYPQVLPVDTGNPFVPYRYNPRGCWDFWGYTQPDPLAGVQVTRNAPQMRAVWAMVEALRQRP